MTDTKTTLQAVIDQTLTADLNPIKDFLFSNPSEPLIATGSRRWSRDRWRVRSSLIRGPWRSSYQRFPLHAQLL